MKLAQQCGGGAAGGLAWHRAPATDAGRWGGAGGPAAGGAAGRQGAAEAEAHHIVDRRGALSARGYRGAGVRAAADSLHWHPSPPTCWSLSAAHLLEPQPGAAGWQDLQASLERVVAVSRNPAPLALGAGGNWGIPGSSIADRSLETPGRSVKRVKRRSVVAPADPRVCAKVKLDADLRFSAGKHGYEADGVWERRHDKRYTGLLHARAWNGPLDKPRAPKSTDPAVESAPRPPRGSA